MQHRSKNKRKFTAWLFILVSLLNLVLNYNWLKTGDAHIAQLHTSMKGGWNGFWFTTILFSVLLVVGLYLLLTKGKDRSD